MSPSGQLIPYTGPHDNDRHDSSVGMGEFRNIDVYHSGTTARDSMCPWVELYEDERGWNDDSPDRSLWVVESTICAFSDRSARQPTVTCDDDGEFAIEETVVDDAEQATGETTVSVRNVAPGVRIDAVRDETGAEVGSAVPAALEGLAVVLAGSFSDPGALDTHVARVDWGDGTVHELGEVLETVSDSHAFPAAGVRVVTLAVTDDDGGEGVSSAEVVVVDASGAIAGAAAFLETLAEDPGLDAQARSNLEDAVDRLIGNNDGRGHNGALDQLEQGNPIAALNEVERALMKLEAAEAVEPGLDLTNYRDWIALAAKSVAVRAIEEARGTATSPNDLRKIQQASDLVALGDASLEVGDHAAAVARYQDAVRLI